MWRNKIPYCAIHGYDFYFQSVKRTNSRVAGFDRIEFILGLMEIQENESPRNDWFWAMGVDTMIMNLGIRIEEFIDNNFHFIISRDFNTFNADSYLIRNSTEGRAWIRFILSQRKNYESNPVQECACVAEHAQDNEWNSIIKEVDQKSFNSYEHDLYGLPTTTKGEYSDGDFLVHWPGVSLQKRMDLSSKYSELIKY